MSRGRLVGTALGAYRLVEFLGAGGMGEVYRAVHASLGRVVAVKVLTGASRVPGLEDRFRNEARIQSAQHHPNIATLFDFLELDGQSCIIMEYVDGETLDALVQRSGTLPPAEALAIIIAAARAAGYLHEHGIVHRDLKCANIKRTTRGVVKLLDFGLAKGPVTPKLTATGHVVGTFDYMSPEQLTMGTVDGRTDLWALGVVLYELLTGRLPFTGGGTLEQMRQVIEARYFPAGVLVPSLPRGVDALIARCLQADPAARYGSAAELIADAEALAARLVGGPAPATNLLSPRWRLPRVALPALAPRTISRGAAALAVGALVVAVAWLRPEPKPKPPVPAGPPPASAAGAQACGAAAQTAPPERVRSVMITVVGGEADVYCRGLRVGRTPFTLVAELGSTVTLILREEGWVEKSVAFTVSEGTRVLSFVLERPARQIGARETPAPGAGLLALAAWLPWPFGLRRRKAAGSTPETRVLDLPVGDGPRPTNTSFAAAMEEPGALVGEIRSDPGCVRDSNEDSIGFLLPAEGEALRESGALLVVADGMGGHSGGEVASRLAVETVVEHYASGNGDPQAALTRAVQLANKIIQLQARSDAALKGMGTTCTALVLRQGWAYCSHVGDSRLYLLRGGDILQLTEDHSAVFNLVKRGVIDREGARVHPDRNVIVRALGSRSEVEVAEWARPMRVMPLDRFVVSSDGLHDLVTDAEIQAAVRDLPPAAACEQLIQVARERGGHDNISVGILAVGGAAAQAGDDAAEPRTAA